tara:strand:- start:44 stop:577 length:534 start_codon:yes stop_codon:yes gene_type:complete
MKELDLFKISLWGMHINDFSRKKEKLNSLFSTMKEMRSPESTFLSSRTSSDDRWNYINYFSDIMKHELELLQSEFMNKIVIRDVWTVRYEKGDYQNTHNHGSLGLSGIIYLDFPDGSATTKYIQPWNDIVKDMTMAASLPVKEGDMVIAPQHLLHYTEPHKSDRPKRIISWDMEIME